MPSPLHAAFTDKEMAASYDERFAKLGPMKEALHLVTGGVLAELPEEARVLCVGAGTGAELLVLARKFPGWRFTAVEPATAMLEVCRRRVAEEGIGDRCVFHEGYLDSLPVPDLSEAFHGATSILVSQFIMDAEERVAFFRGIAERLVPGGILVDADLSADMATADYTSILEVWLRLMASEQLTPEKIEAMRNVYGREVAITPPGEIEGMMVSGGFERPVAVLQALLIRAWVARKG